jgi:hypothetical protein
VGWRSICYTDYAIPGHHMKTRLHLCRDLCDVRAEVEETVDDLKLKTETDCVVCKVGAEAAETVDDSEIKN